MPPVQIGHCGCQRYPLASRAPCGDLRAQLDDRVNGFHRERDFLEVFAATTSVAIGRCAASAAADWSVSGFDAGCASANPCRSEEHTSELPSLMRISYAV